MKFDDFKRILFAFADHPSEVIVDEGRLLVAVRGEEIEANISCEEGTIRVREYADGPRYDAYTWVLRRLAKIDLLADRILSYTPEEAHFVKPRGLLLESLDDDPTEMNVAESDATAALVRTLSRRPSEATNVLYLTSDAGEGKTTIVNHVARTQAERYKTGRAKWLLVPINLGGRPFLRFDDIVVGELVNRLRFQHLYYEAFIELAKLGAIVPAFDGFEEMFVESSTGEAASALGILINHLQASGSVLISARRAYFEFYNFGMQARLFDAMESQSAAFSRLTLQRWRREQFLRYCDLRGFRDGLALHRNVADRWGGDHPLLARAVLVRHLVDVADELRDVDEAIQRIGNDPDHYFSNFVSMIVEREAEEKWLDRSGGAANPLLTTDQHFHLLAMIAQEMWQMQSNALDRDHIDLIAETFAETTALKPAVARQVSRRLPEHSMLAPVRRTSGMVAFDHDDFRHFFLGQALGRALCGDGRRLRGTWLGVGSLPANAVEAASRYVERHGADSRAIVDRVASLGLRVAATSFTKENCGSVALSLIARGVTDVTLKGLVFPTDSLAGLRLERVRFRECDFQPTALTGAELVDCDFRNCRFYRLDDGAAIIRNCVLKDCDVRQWGASGDVAAFDSGGIGRALADAGFRVESSGGSGSGSRSDPADHGPVQDDVETAKRALRVFIRATHVDAAVFRAKMGQQAAEFFDRVLPRLIDGRVLEEVRHSGSGGGTRYRLSVSMRKIAEVASDGGLSLSQLIQRLQGGM